MLLEKSGMRVQCCVCKKFETIDGEWIDAIVDSSIKITHTYCPECFAVVMAEIENSK